MNPKLAKVSPMAVIKNGWFQPRMLVDLLLATVCIGLLIVMLAQLDSLKKIETALDNLRIHTLNK